MMIFLLRGDSNPSIKKVMICMLFQCGKVGSAQGADSLVARESEREAQN